MSKKNAEPKPLFSIEVTPPGKPVALYFRERASGKKAGEFDELSQLVARLAIRPVAGDTEGAHWLSRTDKEGKLVWDTRHPSLQETFWYAEWEYGIKQEQWKANG